jgi:hypothetical protein
MESRHSGFLYARGIDLRLVTVREDGSGTTRLALHTEDELRAIHAVDPAATVGILEAIIGGALVGADEGEDLPGDDRRMAGNRLRFYTEITGRDAGPVLERCELRGRTWCLRHHEAIAAFARELAYKRHLSGEALQLALGKHFARDREPIPQGKALTPWLAERKQAKQKEALRKAAANMDAYFESLLCRR